MAEIEFTTINVSFDALADPVERAFLLALPTSFVMPDAAVDRLRAAAAQPLRDSQQIRELVRNLSASAVAEPAAHLRGSCSQEPSVDPAQRSAGITAYISAAKRCLRCRCGGEAG